jgi:hypothetical protein
VLTDRAFLASPGTMLAAFCTGGTIALMFILLFSFMGAQRGRAARRGSGACRGLLVGRHGEPGCIRFIYKKTLSRQCVRSSGDHGVALQGSAVRASLKRLAGRWRVPRSKHACLVAMCQPAQAQRNMPAASSHDCTVMSAVGIVFAGPCVSYASGMCLLHGVVPAPRAIVSQASGPLHVPPHSCDVPKPAEAVLWAGRLVTPPLHPAPPSGIWSNAYAILQPARRASCLGPRLTPCDRQLSLCK